MLINRLQDNALGKIELTDGQRKSIEILLRKSAPDLQAVTISGDAENPLVILEAASKQLDAKFARAIAGAVAANPPNPDGT
jgi:hypothetical protein